MPGYKFTHDKETRSSFFRKTILLAITFIILYIIGHFLPPGFDWIIFFSKGIYPRPWMPWTQWMFSPLNLPAVFSITMIAIGLRSLKYNSSPIPIFFAFLSLPVLWVLFMGNLDGVVLAGLLMLPHGAPIVLVKPQIASFALLAKPRSLLIGIIWIVVSIAIWGFWPKYLLVVQTPEWKAEWVQDINLFPWGLLVAIPLLWFSRSDEDLLMAAGSFGTPHMFPYNFIVLVPSMARMKPGWMILTWAVSWTPFLSNWLGESAWHFGNLMSVCFWLGIYLNREKPREEDLWPSIYDLKRWLSNIRPKHKLPKHS